LLQDLAEQLNDDSYEHPLVGVQRSHYTNTDHEYFCISLARPLSLSDGTNSCVTIGMAVDETFKRKVRFWNDDTVQIRDVNETCERCSIENCQVRAAKPKILKRHRRIQNRKEALQSLMKTMDADEKIIDSVD
jgi:hypothetical protein